MIEVVVIEVVMIEEVVTEVVVIEVVVIEVVMIEEVVTEVVVIGVRRCISSNSYSGRRSDCNVGIFPINVTRSSRQ